jgi:arginase
MGIPALIKETLQTLAECDLIYISFDVDSMDPTVSGGTGTPVDNGLTVQEALEINRLLIQDPKVCCWEMVEVNPTLDSLNTMAESAFDILETTTSSLIESRAKNTKKSTLR